MNKVDLILRALKEFNTYCYQPRNLLQIKMKAGWPSFTKSTQSFRKYKLFIFTRSLKLEESHSKILNSGDMMWFANNRVLHGRAAFECVPGVKVRVQTIKTIEPSGSHCR